jgi:hypothetical protein
MRGLNINRRDQRRVILISTRAIDAFGHRPFLQQFIICGLHQSRRVFDVLTRANERQLDILLNDDVPRRKWENTTAAIDGLNSKYGRTLISVGPWEPPGEFAGGKISYSRIPRAEDFW